MQQRAPSTWWLLAAMLLALGAGLGGACSRSGSVPVSPQAPPAALRLWLAGSIAGAIEPCGCQKDMQGGVDHAAALLRSTGPPAVLLAAGPLWFQDPTLDAKARQQQLWKAETLATALRDLQLAAWVPAFNDWADGPETLRRLHTMSGATLVAANLEGAELLRVLDVGGVKVGVTGVARPERARLTPPGVSPGGLREGMKRGLDALRAAGAEVLVVLLTAPRGEALRLAEEVPGFHLMVIGKPFDQGEGNDAPLPPVLVQGTLVVQPQNHLQALEAVDIHLRERSFALQDGSDLAGAERRISLARRIDELRRRIELWERTPGIAAADVAARRAELQAAEKELAAMPTQEPPRQGSYFVHRLFEVREKVGTDDGIARRLSEYYRRVNDHNREAFRGRVPPAVGEGESGYLGVEVCAACHVEATRFWRTTGHARAYATLEKQHKEFNLDCVSCHVTGYERPGGSTVTHVEKLKDVQCEVCHGPGSRHPNDPSNPALIVKKPARDLCAPACHHPPHVGPEWSVDTAWPHILGPGHGKPAE